MNADCIPWFPSDVIQKTIRLQVYSTYYVPREWSQLKEYTTVWTIIHIISRP